MSALLFTACDGCDDGGKKQVDHDNNCVGADCEDPWVVAENNGQGPESCPVACDGVEVCRGGRCCAVCAAMTRP